MLSNQLRKNAQSRVGEGKGWTPLSAKSVKSLSVEMAGETDGLLESLKGAAEVRSQKMALEVTATDLWQLKKIRTGLWSKGSMNVNDEKVTLSKMGSRELRAFFMSLQDKLATTTKGEIQVGVENTFEEDAAKRFEKWIAHMIHHIVDPNLEKMFYHIQNQIDQLS